MSQIREPLYGILVMQVFKDYIVASTRIDLRGRSLSEEEIRKAFEQMEDLTLLNQEHNAALPPVGQMSNKRLKRLDTGDLAIIADVEIQDGVEIPEGAGISLTFAKRHFSVNRDQQGDVALLINSDHFEIQDFEQLAQLSDSSFQIDVVEIEQRSLESIGILILKFVVFSILSDFVSSRAKRAGKALLNELKRLSDKTFDETGRETVLQIHCNLESGGRIMPPILQIDRERMLDIQSGDISVDEAAEYIRNVVGDSDIQKAF